MKVAALSLILVVACLAAVEPSNEPRFMLTPSWVALTGGDTAQLYLVLPSGDTVPAGGATWTSSDSAIARVGPDGIVHSLRDGEALISASAPTSLGNIRGVARVIVAPAVLVGAGDIGECASTGAAETAALLDATPGIVFAAGDNAYPDGSPADYSLCYAPTWGRHRDRTRPAPGNHDYRTLGASGYFAYFGANAGSPGTGYYSFRLGAWHVIVLNSNIPFGPASIQQGWLRNDLANHAGMCTVAYWHHPRFSSGRIGSDTNLTALWRTLEQGGADVAITGHDHHYERFAPQLSDGTPDTRGIREFVVGTGGGVLFPMGATAANSEIRVPGTYGVLKLSLLAGSYRWRFIGAPGGEVLDSGTADCL